MQFRILLMIAIFFVGHFNFAIAQDSTAQDKTNFLPNLGPPAARDKITIELFKVFSSLDEQYALEDALVAALKKSHAGDFDGTLKSVDGSAVLFYVYSNDIPKAENAISVVLKEKGYFSGTVLELKTFQKNGTTKVQRLLLE